MLNSVALGFLIVVGLYLLLFGVILLFRDKISAKVTNEIITAMMSKDEKDDEEAANSLGDIESGTEEGA